jgi:hypothetical protein
MESDLVGLCFQLRLKHDLGEKGRRRTRRRWRRRRKEWR